MNPRLIKFTVELQNEQYNEKEKTFDNFKSNGKKEQKFFNFFRKLAEVTVPINKD